MTRAERESSALPTSEPSISMASTIGPIDAGIVAALETAFLKKTGLAVRHIGAGTGAALDIAKNGSIDIVLVHAPALEEKFIADGFGIDRRDLMYNDFVILGPVSDPAGIRNEHKATEAFRKIAASEALTVTRGDDSGTGVKEMELWAKAGIEPAGEWYVTFEFGSTGNMPTLRFADQRQAYVLIDRATYITLKKEITLQIMVEKDADLINSFAIIRISPDRFPNVSSAGAKLFSDWLVSDEAQEIIKSFGVEQYGGPLFFPNSDQWRQKHQSA